MNASWSRVRAVIFDLDGTLTDTTTGIVEAARVALATVGACRPPADQVKPLIGLPLEQMFGRLLPPGSTAAAVAACISAYRSYYDRAIMPRTRLFPDARDALERCRAAGVRLAVATSKLTPLAEQALAIAGARHYFDLVVGSDQVRQPKPHPEMVYLILAALAVVPQEALMVGDAIHDIAMGRAAGLTTCGVATGAANRDTLHAAGADYVVANLDEVAALVCGIPASLLPGQ